MKLKLWLRNVVLFTSGWIISLLVWRFIRISGAQSSLEALNLNQTYFYYLVFCICVSIIAGLIFGSVQYYYENAFNKKGSFKTLLLSALLTHITIMLFIYIGVFFIINGSSLAPYLTFNDFIFNATIAANLLYSLIINSLIVFILYLGKLFGRGNLFKMITGQFYHPKEELRLFMFLDLESSTLIAEKLGHLKYSALIQDCFYDLSVLEDSNANVYQYVGDEAVLTWRLKSDKINAQVLDSIHAFFLYKHRLEDRKQYYLNTYGLIPKFKAGLHQGLVTTVEVGSLKKEIAYHGETMNIGSRIQGLCKQYGEELLISEQVYESINSNKEYIFKQVDQTTLKGKTKATLIYSVNKA